MKENQKMDEFGELADMTEREIRLVNIIRRDFNLIFAKYAHCLLNEQWADFRECLNKIKTKLDSQIEWLDKNHYIENVISNKTEK